MKNLTKTNCVLFRFALLIGIVVFSIFHGIATIAADDGSLAEATRLSERSGRPVLVVAGNET